MGAHVLGLSVGSLCQNSNSRDGVGPPANLSLRRFEEKGPIRDDARVALPQMSFRRGRISGTRCRSTLLSKGEIVKNSLLVLSALMPFLAAAKTSLPVSESTNPSTYNSGDPNLQFESDSGGGVEYALVIPDHSSPAQISQLIREVRKLQDQGLLKFNAEDGVIEVKN